MIRTFAISLVLLATACSGLGLKDKSVREKPAQSGIARQPDHFCMEDCLGNGGDRQLCEDRCTD